MYSVIGFRCSSDDLDVFNNFDDFVFAENENAHHIDGPADKKVSPALQMLMPLNLVVCTN